MTGNEFFFSWEPELMAWLQQFMNPFMVTLATILTYFGEELLIVAIFAFVYYCLDKEAGSFMGMTMMFANTGNAMVKNMFLRYRPYMVHPEVECLKPVDSSADIYNVNAQGYSFPSGHAQSSVSYTIAAAYWFKKHIFTILAIVIPLLVGFSRVALGVHYPTDVLAGWALGLVCFAVSTLLYKKIKKRWVIYLILTVLCLPGLFYCRTSDYFSSSGMLIGFFIGDLIERKYVRFKNTRKWYRILLRMAGAFVLFFGLNTVLKLPFTSEFLHGGSFLSGIVRSVRYCLILLILVAVYPLSFRILDRREDKKAGSKNA